MCQTEVEGEQGKNGHSQKKLQKKSENGNFCLV